MMTPQEINIEIAGVVKPEYEWFVNYHQEAIGWLKGKESSSRIVCPNFHGSLDACVEFEKTLSTKHQRWTYIKNLVDTTKAECLEEYAETFVLATATASQRCEAFLRTVGKWKD